MPTLSRRAVLSLALGAAALPAVGQNARPTVSVAKTASCGCCGAWIDHMRDAGFDVQAHDMAPGALSALKTRLGVTPALSSCHTAVVDGYVVEGHVPAEDVRRLLREKPQAAGLSVPGMPLGSPGMEMGDARDPFDTLLIALDGSAGVYAAHR
jgi:hypothetical protein